MKIGYDGKRAVRNLTGLGNYSRLVIESMARSYADHSHVIYTPDMRENPRLDGIRELPNVQFKLPQGGSHGALWRTWGITGDARRDGIDIFHGLSNELPLNFRKSGVKSVVTIHDLIYRRMPECYTLIDRTLYDFKYRRSCHVADRIIAISESTRRDIVELYGISEEKIDIVYQGCSDIFRRQFSVEELAAVSHKYSLPERYLLQVGTIEQRKNLELTIRALSALPDDIHLVAVGNGKEYKTQMKRLSRELGVEQRVHYLGNVAFVDLPGVCQGAEVILYPSRYEGFGIPVLEGLESRRPVIAARTSSLPEAGGDAAIYVGPDDVRGTVEAINSILNGAVNVNVLIAKGLKHAARFNNDDMAQRIMAVYDKTLKL
jgi:glycosyltransferase involved in cell wall biosynthesis